MPQGMFVKPANKVLVKGDPLIVECEIGANATAAQMVAGRFVIHDTNDGDVKEAGAKADAVIGILMEQADELEVTAYAVGDPCRVIIGGQCLVKVTLASGGAAVAPGTPIVTAANGKAAAQAVGAMGAQGTVIGVAMETQDPAAADKECVILFRVSAEPAAAA